MSEKQRMGKKPPVRTVEAEYVAPEDRPPIYTDATVADLVDRTTGQLAADLYKVLTELKITRKYTFDNPRRVYRLVGWYLREEEIRLSIILRDKSELVSRILEVDT